MGQGRKKSKGFERRESRRVAAVDLRHKRKKEEKAKGIISNRQPSTIDQLRVEDETMIRDEHDEELVQDDNLDEFSPILSGTIEPKVMITTTRDPNRFTKRLAKELRNVVPNAVYRKRGAYSLNSVITSCTQHSYTTIILIEQGQERKRPDGLWIAGLPNGPTAHFRIGKVLYKNELEMSGKSTNHFPELNLHGFKTRLGHRIGRMFQSVFPPRPDLEGRQLVTFHNQRDWIFFRRHRFILEDFKTARLQELGPRISLHLLTLQQGAFSRHSQYEYLPRVNLNRDKRQFFL
ncbi:putative Ribosome production factor 1 [Blattamonas nauphoetae]|uniref:Ribosome production factor 1 n=1 Tax=Blattamonas nauphoetae TaxID=2049346 RepID=A0ABQ9YKC2_9EUKA|nr:putative Ribosome production factor 1 [Blattamonas nauphoetae]